MSTSAPLRIVLTGGPCAGKTTALTRIRDWLVSQGVRPFIVPELPTLFLEGGIRFDIDRTDVLAIQGDLIKTQMAMEDAFVTAARHHHGRSVIVADRGTLDPAAYTGPSGFQVVLDTQGWNKVHLRDHRYDAVLHLVTAANGAEAFYNHATNPHRTETLEQALDLDRRVMECWLGHPHLRIIDNSTDFENKIRRALTSIAALLGAPEPLEIERKFLLTPDRNNPFGCLEGHVRYEVVDIEQVYGEGFRVRRRGQGGNFTYTKAVKRDVKEGVRIEEQTVITAPEYHRACREAKGGMIIKKRACFVWDSRYFELDWFWSPVRGSRLLEIETDTEGETVNLPPFLPIVREGTRDVSFSNKCIAETGSIPA